MLKTLLNIISTNIVVFISRFSPQNKFIIFLFDFFNEKCSDLIYLQNIIKNSNNKFY